MYIYKALQQGWTEERVVELTQMDPWFVAQFGELVRIEKWLGTKKLAELTREDFFQLKRKGFSDPQIARAVGVSDPLEVRTARKALGVVPSYKRVDTCAAEFEANTPYQYSCYDGDCEAHPSTNRKVLILGGGPNRIGQGIEFDYCCCHASFSLRKAGFETIMMNCNPETVSTDYDTSDRLYFEPMTVEDVLNVIEVERPDGIIVQFGGQTPLKLATPIQRYLDQHKLQAASGRGPVQIWGTQPQDIDRAEDRKLWYDVLSTLNIEQPPGRTVKNEDEALAAAHDLGYPVMVRPSFVLGGRAMEIVRSDADMRRYLKNAIEVEPDKPLLVDKYLDNATELDVDALCDKDGNVVIAGIMEHIEQAGIHSGDSACSIPTQTLPESALKTIREWTIKLAKHLNVVGLINIQYAVQDSQVYIIEANPRASRTVPFVAKAIGHPIAKYASLLMGGKTLAELGFSEEPRPEYVSVKEVVLPFEKFQGSDVLLGPEMRSTGEVMGIDKDFATAYLKAQLAAGQRLPRWAPVPPCTLVQPATDRPSPPLAFSRGSRPPKPSPSPCGGAASSPLQAGAGLDLHLCQRPEQGGDRARGPGAPVHGVPDCRHHGHRGGPAAVRGQVQHHAQGAGRAAQCGRPSEERPGQHDDHRLGPERAGPGGRQGAAQARGRAQGAHRHHRGGRQGHRGRPQGHAQGIHQPAAPGLLLGRDEEQDRLPCLNTRGGAGLPDLGVAPKLPGRENHHGGIGDRYSSAAICT